MTAAAKKPTLAPLELDREQLHAIVTAAVELAASATEPSPKSALVRRFGGVDAMLERRQLLLRAWAELQPAERIVLEMLSQPMKGRSRRPGADEVLAALLAGATDDATSAATIVRGTDPELTIEVVLAAAKSGRLRLKRSASIRELLSPAE